MTLPRLPKSRVVTLPRRAGDKPQETSVAINPRDPRNAVVSYHQAVGHGSDHHPGMQVEVHAATTFDGGETWSTADLSHPAYPISIDATAGFDLHGHAYVVHMGMEKIAWEPLVHGEYVHRSVDGGRTWLDPVALAERPGTETILEHMPKIAADNSPDSPYAGNVYVVWDRMLHDRREEMVIVRSTDGGDSWSEPSVISRHSGATLPAIAVAPDGTVFVGYVEGTEGGSQSGPFELLVEISRDGGVTIAPPARITDTSRVLLGLDSFPRACWIPTLGVDPSGRLYGAWADEVTGRTDLFCSTSEDQGATWREPTRVNDDPVQTGADKALQYLAVDASDGSAYVLFYDRRDDPDNRLATVTLARSTDGGHTFENYAFGEQASDPGLASFGDYIGAAAQDGLFYGAWPEHVAGEAQPEVSPEHDLGGGAVLDEGQWPFGPSAIRVGIADLRVLTE